MGALVYGCDICQDVCPWNRRAAISDAPEWLPRDGVADRDLASWWRLSDDEIACLIEGTPMTRAGVVLLRRNLAIAMGNAVGTLSCDVFDEPGKPPRDSVLDPVVAECVAWARDRLGGTNGAR